MPCKSQTPIEDLNNKRLFPKVLQITSQCFRFLFFISFRSQDFTGSVRLHGSTVSSGIPFTAGKTLPLPSVLGCVFTCPNSSVFSWEQRWQKSDQLRAMTGELEELRASFSQHVMSNMRACLTVCLGSLDPLSWRKEKPWWKGKKNWKRGEEKYFGNIELCILLTLRSSL